MGGVHGSCTSRAMSLRGLALAAALLPAVGAPAAMLTVESATVTVGGQGVVLVRGTGLVGVEGVDLTLLVNPALVLPSAPVVAGVSVACAAIGNVPEPGVVRLAMACMHALESDGLLLSMPVSGLAVGSSGVTITACRLDEDARVCTTVAGEVQVVAPTPTPLVWPTPTATTALVGCDATGNGSISALDATRVLQFVAGIRPSCP